MLRRNFWLAGFWFGVSISYLDRYPKICLLSLLILALFTHFYPKFHLKMKLKERKLRRMTASNKPKQQGNWVPIGDHYPLAGEDVLLCDDHGAMIVDSMDGDENWSELTANPKMLSWPLVAWQYLPKPYKPEKK